MMKRKTYYVSPKGEIFPIKTDQNLQLFEIKATEQELNKFKVAIEEFNSSEDAEKADFFSTNHFKETKVDEDRNVTYGKMIEVYKWIYTLGTSETKLQIERMNVLPKLEEKPKMR